MPIHTMPALRVIAILCACGLVLASMGFGAIFAWTVGSQHSLPLAVLSVVMAVALEGIKPLAISQALRSFASFHVFRAIALALLGLVAVAYSLTSEITLVATSKGDMAAQRQSAIRTAQDAQRERDRITAEIDRLGILRPSQAIQGELNAVLSDRRLKNCEGWLPGIRYRAICIETVAPLKAELAKAQRREGLEVQLAKLTQSSGSLSERGTIGTADAGSKAIGTYLKLAGVVLPEAILSQWLVLVPVLALELGSALSVVLVQALGSGPQLIGQTHRTTVVQGGDHSAEHL